MKFIKYAKKNSSAVIGISVFVLVIVALLLIKNLFMFDESQAIYGTRLEGIDKVKVMDNQKKDVQEKLSDSTKKVSVRIAGKTIQINITTNEDVSIDTAKELGNKSLEAFTEEQKKYYDIQIFIQNKGNEEQFPIIGYKQHTRDGITWTKDRAGN